MSAAHAEPSLRGQVVRRTTAHGLTLELTMTFTVFVKKYTEDHEWIEMDTDGVTGTSLLHIPYHMLLCCTVTG